MDELEHEIGVLKIKINSVKTRFVHVYDSQIKTDLCITHTGNQRLGQVDILTMFINKYMNVGKKITLLMVLSVSRIKQHKRLLAKVAFCSETIKISKLFTSKTSN